MNQNKEDELNASIHLLKRKYKKLVLLASGNGSTHDVESPNGVRDERNPYLHQMLVAYDVIAKRPWVRTSLAFIGGSLLAHLFYADKSKLSTTRNRKVSGLKHCIADIATSVIKDFSGTIIEGALRETLNPSNGKQLETSKKSDK